jgi:DNA-binding transcriptional ArsR family regulator
MEEKRSAAPTAQALRALAHPLRLQMLGLLRLEPALTASELAARLGVNTGSTSYHLRQLAKHGFIVDAPGLGTRRERHWRAAHDSTTVDERLEDPDAEDAFLQAALVTWTRSLQQAVQERSTLPPQWRALSTFNDYLLMVTADQAQDLVAQLLAVLDTAHAATPRPAQASPETAAYLVQLHAYPAPEGARPLPGRR